VIACGQIKPHGDGTRELASIAVIEKYRGQGLARRMIELLLESVEYPVYLTCRARLQPFYEKFGFAVIQPALLPNYFHRIHSLAQTLRKLSIIHEKLLVMKLEYKSVADCEPPPDAEI
jgi:predicted N-acetyltransferase YhbS